MSRFFAAGSDSSDASDDDASFSDASSDASSLEVQEVKKNPFLRDAAASSDSDSEGERKLLKSSKLKLLEQQRKITASLNDALDSQDYVAAVQLNDKMIKLLKQEPPRFYIRFLVRLADEIAKAHKFSNQLNAKAYNVLKQKIKKSPFLDQMDSFRNNPVTELDSADEADESAKDNQKQSVTFEKVATDKLTSVQLFERLAEIIQARGKKNTDKALQIENLVLLLSQSTTPYQKIKCLLALIPARFDLVPQNTAIMSTEIWKQCIGEVKLLHDLLDENDHIIVGDFPENDELEAEHTRDKRITSGDSVSLNGIISSFVDRLDDEFFKSLQNIDPHTLEYVARLKDELFLYAMIFRAEKYSQRVGAPPQVLDLLKMRRVEHLYFKPDVIIESFINYTQSLYPLLFGDDSKTSLVTELCTELYKTTIDRIKIRALLCHVYHIAMHDKHQEARNMMLMSHLQETISKSDIQTQALYNRTIVQLGLCAFRAGLFWEAHTYLQEIASCGKTKELLAQGMSSQRNIEKSIEQEKIEKQRQLPFHMHVNLELLDSVYLTSAMFLEVPHAALNTSDSQRRPISKSFRRMIDYYERQIFTGPPENIRDHIMEATKAVVSGDWEIARDFICNLKIWELLSNAEEVKVMLGLKIQQVSLLTFVLTNYRFYDNLSLESLGNMFSLDLETVRSTLSKLIVQDELVASIDQDNFCHIIQARPPSKITFLADLCLEKIAMLIDSKEALALANTSISKMRSL